ncbi:hypothetical protein M9H77_08817 [Catharanthus roseus]|uniref:Uncharacterized protein n=1 Tax=Catharanthus roseus TaxID=4058 RepID=A0ACC0BZ16_CATRO|nr:hypothetical protein M9H77_08817 [Catharanthus roseus]
MNEKSIEKKECNEFKEKERVEEKERLIEELCFFDSMSTLFEECKKDDCEKEKEIDFEKSERRKENECFIERQESIKEEKNEKEVVSLDKSSLDYKIYKTISLFTPTSYFCFEHFLIETKLNSLALIFIGLLLNILALGHQYLERTIP